MYILVLFIVLRIFMYIYSVTPKLRLACELLSADFTNYSGLRMNSHMKLQIVLPCKSLMAQITLKGGFSRCLINVFLSLNELLHLEH